MAACAWANTRVLSDGKDAKLRGMARPWSPECGRRQDLVATSATPAPYRIRKERSIASPTTLLASSSRSRPEGGLLTEAEAGEASPRNVITRALGGVFPSIPMTRVDSRPATSISSAPRSHWHAFPKVRSRSSSPPTPTTRESMSSVDRRVNDTAGLKRDGNPGETTKPLTSNRILRRLNLLPRASSLGEIQTANRHRRQIVRGSGGIFVVKPSTERGLFSKKAKDAFRPNARSSTR